MTIGRRILYRRRERPTRYIPLYITLHHSTIPSTNWSKEEVALQKNEDGEEGVGGILSVLDEITLIPPGVSIPPSIPSIEKN